MMWKKLLHKKGSAKKQKADLQKDGTSISLTFPSELGIELVQANDIKNYEIFQWLTALTSTLGAGFAMSYFLTEKQIGKTGLGISALTFVLLTVLFAVLAWRSRRKAFSGRIKKSIKLVKWKGYKE